MPKTYKRLKFKIFLLFFLTAAILLPDLSPPSEARKPVRWRAKKVVVIDPGHGGHESGARGLSGTQEKDVTYALARRVESELKGRLKVQLTRTDDYGIDLIRRIDVANHLKADVFISIHAGGSYQHDARGMSVYYFRENRSDVPDRNPAENHDWDRLQLHHVNESRRLAESLKNRLQQVLPTTSCQVDAAPLLVLRGADMPAVLIEVGYLTNTEDEKRLNEEDNLASLGRAIAAGISEFLKKLDTRSDQ